MITNLQSNFFQLALIDITAWIIKPVTDTNFLKPCCEILSLTPGLYLYALPSRDI